MSFARHLLHVSGYAHAVPIDTWNLLLYQVTTLMLTPWCSLHAMNEMGRVWVPPSVWNGTYPASESIICLRCLEARPKSCSKTCRDTPIRRQHTPPPGIPYEGSTYAPSGIVYEGSAHVPLASHTKAAHMSLWHCIRRARMPLWHRSTLSCDTKLALHRCHSYA